MVDHATEDLHYGSLGEIHYSADEGTWSAPRRPFSASSLTPFELIFRRNGTDLDKMHWSSVSAIPENHADGIDEVGEDFPEIEPGLSLLHELNRSRDRRSFFFGATNKALQRSYGLLSIGNTSGFSGLTKNLYPIIAFPSGENRSELRLEELELRRRGWSQPATDSPDAVFDSQEPVYSSASIWECPTGRIYQVKFCEARDDRSTFLSVRSATAIDIFNPNLVSDLRSSQAGGRSRAHAIEPGHLMQLQQGDVSDQPCSDIDFNPSYQRQFVVVDILGRFKIFEISERKHLGGSHKARATSRGRMDYEETLDDEMPRGKPGPVSTHPHLVFWINTRTFVVVGKTMLSAFDSTNTTVALTTLDITGLFRDVIVDTKPSPFGDNELFVLTSVHLVMVQLEVKEGNARFTILKTWRHYFSALESGMRISYRGSKRTASHGLVLYSTESAIVAEYTLEGLQAMDDAQSLTISNPSSLGSSLANDRRTKVEAETGLTDLLIREVDLDDSGDTEYASQSARYELYQMVTLDRCLSLSGYISAAPTEVGMIVPGQPTNWAGKVLRHKSIRKKYGTEDFLVEDDDPPSGVDEPPAREQAILRQADGHEEGEDEGDVDESNDDDSSFTQAESESVDEDTSAVSNELVYEALILPNADDMQVDLADVMHLTRGSFAGRPVSASELRSALMMASLGSLTIQDLDETSHGLSVMGPMNLRNGATELPGLTSSGIAKPSLLGIEHMLSSESQEPTALAIYSSLIQQHILPLSPHVPARTRVRLEGLARSAAASIWLSSNQVHLPGQQSPYPTASQVSRGTTNQDVSSPPPASSSSLPYLAMSSQDSMIRSQPATQLLDSSHGLEPAAPADPVISRLSAYTTFSAPLPSKSPVQSVLDHWELGSDPSTYSWRDTTARVSGTTYVRGSALSEEAQAKRRRQEERAAERAAKRTRREAMASSAVTQPPPENRGAMSSQAAPRGVSTSQMGESQAGGPQMVASQVQPGKFGGRPNIGKLVVGRRRRAGF